MIVYSRRNETYWVAMYLTSIFLRLFSISSMYGTNVGQPSEESLLLVRVNGVSSMQRQKESTAVLVHRIMSELCKVNSAQA